MKRFKVVFWGNGYKYQEYDRYDTKEEAHRVAKELKENENVNTDVFDLESDEY